MRIWHESLIPKLCRNHLLGMWREGLGAYSIIVNNKKGYRNHPAVKEFEDTPDSLWCRLLSVREEMHKRGYHPKVMPELTCKGKPLFGKLKEWQTLEQQIKILKAKNCDCKI